MSSLELNSYSTSTGLSISWAQETIYLIGWVNICTIFQQQLNDLLPVFLTGNMKRSKSILMENMNQCYLKLQTKQLLSQSIELIEPLFFSWSLECYFCTCKFVWIHKNSPAHSGQYKKLKRMPVFFPFTLLYFLYSFLVLLSLFFYHLEWF